MIAIGSQLLGIALRRRTGAPVALDHYDIQLVALAEINPLV